MIFVDHSSKAVIIRKEALRYEEQELFSCLQVNTLRKEITLDPRHVSKNALANIIWMSYPEIFSNPTDPKTVSLYSEIKDIYAYRQNEFERLCEERLWYYKTFYQHQKDVLYFSAHRKVSQSSMEQGLGKTIVSISDSIVHDYNLTCVITTATSKWNWFEDLTDLGKSPNDIHWEFDPKWFTIYDGKKTVRGLDEKILLINYDMLNKFGNEILAKKPNHFIIDECHRVKNHDSKRTKRVIDICKRSGAKVSLLSGTPAPNTTVDYWTYLNIANHPYGKNYYAFLKEFANVVETKYGKHIVGAKNTDKLNMAISNFMIRKTKAKCLDLPDKKYIRSFFEMEEYKEEYDKHYQEFISKSARNNNISEQKMAIHTVNNIVAKAKVKGVIELIETILLDEEIDIVDGKEVSSRKKVAVFATYKEPIAMLKEHFKDRCVVLDGSVDTNRRMDLVREFKNNPKVDLFIGQTAAAGEALNMTFCNECILLNFTLTRNEIDQITDRFHRIGLKKMLNVYFAMCRNSIDESLYSLFTRKYKDTSHLIDGAPDELSPEDAGMKQLILNLTKPVAA